MGRDESGKSRDESADGWDESAARAAAYPNRLNDLGTKCGVVAAMSAAARQHIKKPVTPAHNAGITGFSAMGDTGLEPVTPSLSS